MEVSKFLQEEGVLYEKWNISKLPTHLNENYSLTDENKAEILAIFQKKSLMFQHVEVIKHMM